MICCIGSWIRLEGGDMASSTTPALALIRFKASVQFPYFASILFGLIPIEKVNDPNHPTMAVDKYMRLYYNPDLLTKVSEEEAVGILIHEINHLLRDHPRRGVHYEPKLFNIAADMEINDDIIADANCGVKLPDWCVFPKSHNLPNDQLAEWYFNKLIEQAKISKNGKGDIHLPGGGNCGSSATGQSDADEEPMEDDGSNGHSETMVDFYRKGTAEAIEEHSKSRGTVPGYLQRWAKEHLKSKVDWRRELRAACLNSINMVASGMTDYTRNKPSRRQASNADFVLPGFVSPTPTVAIIVDTSGSMSEKHISQAIAEVGTVLQNTRSNIILVDVDAAVHYIGPIKDKKQIKLSGGGGTDLPCAYEALSKYKTKCNLVIALTDGYTPWPAEPLPHTKNVICIISTKEEDEGIKGCPEWAKIVRAVINE